MGSLGVRQCPVLVDKMLHLVCTAHPFIHTQHTHSVSHLGQGLRQTKPSQPHMCLGVQPRRSGLHVSVCMWPPASRVLTTRGCRFLALHAYHRRLVPCVTVQKPLPPQQIHLSTLKCLYFEEQRGTHRVLRLIYCGAQRLLDCDTWDQCATTCSQNQTNFCCWPQQHDLGAKHEGTLSRSQLQCPSHLPGPQLTSCTTKHLLRSCNIQCSDKCTTGLR